MSFCPKIIYETIKKRIPDFEMTYNIDPLRQVIADSWPNSLDDSCARNEWGWNPYWDLEKMTDDMLKILEEKYGISRKL
jgi:nucleoside-diphosphate-sugar epimerase